MSTAGGGESKPGRSGLFKKPADTVSTSDDFYLKLYKCVEFACGFFYNPRDHAFARGRTAPGMPGAVRGDSGVHCQT